MRSMSKKKQPNTEYSRRTHTHNREDSLNSSTANNRTLSRVNPLTKQYDQANNQDMNRTARNPLSKQFDESALFKQNPNDNFNDTQSYMNQSMISQSVMGQPLANNSILRASYFNTNSNSKNANGSVEKNSIRLVAKDQPTAAKVQNYQEYQRQSSVNKNLLEDSMMTVSKLAYPPKIKTNFQNKSSQEDIMSVAREPSISTTRGFVQNQNGSQLNQNILDHRYDGLHQSIISNSMISAQEPSSLNLLNRQRKLVENVDNILVQKNTAIQNPKLQRNVSDFNYDQSVISVSVQDKRMQFQKSPQFESSILKDLDADKEFYNIRRDYQNAELNDSHMNMSLSQVSNQSEIENQFQKPLGVTEKYNIPNTGIVNRFKKDPKSFLRRKDSSNVQGVLNQSVLEGLESKSNTKLLYDVSLGYFENLAISFRRILTSLGQNIDEQRELLNLREQLKVEGDEISLEQVQKIVTKNDFWNLMLFALVLLVVFSIFFKLLF